MRFHAVPSSAILFLFARIAVAADAPSEAVIAPGGSESRLAIRGDRVVVSFVDGSGAPAIAVSKDAGRTFSPPSPVPIPTPIGAPDVAFTKDGDLLVVSGSSSSAGSPLLVRSSDGGDHFAQAYAAYKALSATNPRFAVDAGLGSPRSGSDYLSAWDYNSSFFYYGGLDVSVSADNDNTFTDMGVLCDDGSAAAAVSPDGTLYLAYRTGNSAEIARSTNYAARYAIPGVPSNAGPLALGVDDQGIVHVAFAAPPVVHVTVGAPLVGPTGDRSDIYYTRSTDGLATFSQPVRLNDDTGLASQTSPVIAVPHDGRGAVAVFWRDRRNDPTDDVQSDIYMAVSSDHGLTFGPNRRVSGRTWLESRSPYSPYVSSEGGSVASPDGTAHVAWTDDRGVVHTQVSLYQPAGAADFGVSVTPYAAVPAGRPLQVDVATSGTQGFSADLQLAAACPDDGLACSLEAGTVAAGERTTLTVSTAATTAPGVHLVTLTASAGGTTRRTDLHLNVYDPAREATLPVNVSSSRGDAKTRLTPAFDSSGGLNVLYADDSSSPFNAGLLLRRSSDVGHTFSEPAPVGADSTSTFAICPSGAIYAVQGNTYTDRIFVVSRSVDGGATFQPLFRSPPQYGPPYAAIACSRDGSVAAVWPTQDRLGQTTALLTSISRDGITFADPIPVDPATPAYAADYGRPVATWDSKGGLWALFTRIDKTAGYQSSIARLSTAGAGQPFRLVHDFAGTNFNSVLPSAQASSLAVAADGTIHVGWLSVTNNSGGAPVASVAMASSSQDGGATFRDVAVSRPDGFASDASVTPSGNGGAIALWASDGQIWYARSQDSGKTFSGPANLSASPGRSYFPLASADASGNVFVAWTDESRGHPQVFGAWIPTLAPASPLAAFIDLPSADVTAEAQTSVAFRGFGTGAVLLAPHWDFGDGTSADAESVSHIYDAVGTFTAVFTVTDPAGRSASAPRQVTVRAPVPTDRDSELMLPVVADIDGRSGARFTTDVTLVARAVAGVTALLEYTAADGRGSGIVPVRLEPGEERVIPGILAFLRTKGLAIPDGGAAGSLRIVFRGARPGEAWAFARTSTPCGSGTCGVSYDGAHASTSALSVVGLQENDAFRSNLALVNLGEGDVVLRVTLLGPSGETLGVLPDQTVPAFGWLQLARPLLGLAPAGRALVTRVSGGSRFSAYGVLNDQTTSDGSFLAPVTESLATDVDRLVPVVLDATGLSLTRYLTELTLANLTDAPLTLTLTFQGGAVGSGSAAVPLTPGQQIIEPDAISFLRRNGLAIPDGGAAGSLLVSAGSPASSFAAFARTYTSAPSGGTYGVSYPGLLASESATTRAFVFGLEEDGSARSNLAVVNRGHEGDSIALEIRFFDASGAPLGAPVTVALGPGEWRQLARPLAALGASSGYARIDRVAGSSLFVAYGVTNDASTSDGSILPMNVAP